MKFGLWAPNNIIWGKGLFTWVFQFRANGILWKKSSCTHIVVVLGFRYLQAVVWLSASYVDFSPKVDLNPVLVGIVGRHKDGVEIVVQQKVHSIGSLLAGMDVRGDWPTSLVQTSQGSWRDGKHKDSIGSRSPSINQHIGRFSEVKFVLGSWHVGE